MDDFVLTNLYESRNEWCCRLLNIFTPLVIEGLQSIFTESWNICIENREINKYLMTFQNLLCRVPKWNAVIIEQERLRMIERSGCNYLEDLITCVHIIQLKVLTSIRVSNKQKKIDITIPKLDNFIHKIYIATARKVYTNVYLFERDIDPLNTQKNNRELEKIVQECIMRTIQDSIPTNEIIRAYLDSSVEIEEEVTIEDLQDPKLAVNGGSPTTHDEDNTATKTGEPDDDKEAIPDVIPSIRNINDDPVTTRLTFNEYDTILDGNDEIHDVKVSKSIDDLERNNTDKYLNTINEDDDEDGDKDANGYGKLKIFENDDVELFGVESLDAQKASKQVSTGDPLDFDLDEL
jgi:hypothetical protein